LKKEKNLMFHSITPADGVVIAVIIAVMYLLISLNIDNPIYKSNIVISLNTKYLPAYALFSFLRMLAAYILSLVFTLIYGYVASQNKKAEKIMLPLLDILQSIPVLSFLPAVVLGLVAIFPHSSLGVELSSIILIFTGQVWNMTFSFYHSLTTIPRDLDEVASTFKLNKWQKFKKLQLPFSAIGLVWNSMMSWAGGWFFLMACEMFTLKDNDFRLPGLGSYLQTAAFQGDTKALLHGLITMIILIVLIDQLLWRPIIAWSDKFKVELTGGGDAPESVVLYIIRRSVLIETLSNKVTRPMIRYIDEFLNKLFSPRGTPEYEIGMNQCSKARRDALKKWVYNVLGIAAILLFAYGAFRAAEMLLKLSGGELTQLFPSALASLVRVIVAQIIALLWTVPIGVAVGLNKKLANILQPIIQIVASIPATALFPVLLIALLKFAGGLNIASVALMLLGTQWYILFNVIAGAMSIPEDLKEAAANLGLKGFKKWKTLILPAIFPSILTGLVTATGGSWNATIVSEYIGFGGEHMKTLGLGALIAQSTDIGNYPMLLASTLVMIIIVVGTNRFIWKKLFRFSEERFRLDI